MKNVIVLLMACCLIFSCNKSNECGKKCIDIKIQGQIKNMEDNVGIPDVPVTIAWNSYKTWFGSPDVIRITTGNADKFGNYDFVVTIDSSLFQQNYIKVEIPADKTFLYSNCYNGGDKLSYRITSIYDGKFLFEAYPKAILTLKVTHPTNSTLFAGEIGHSFGEQISKNYGDYLWVGRKEAKDSTIRIEARSSVMTRIYWNKYTAPGQSTNYQDSIICKKNVENVFKITF